MLGLKKGRPAKLDKEYLELKQTIWSLQMVASSLQATADEFQDRLIELKELNDQSSKQSGDNKNDDRTR